ncbi:hypothetical protein pphageT12_29 [Pseudomonas phage pphageT12]|nr:hypothetical protein pphageT12_29 [Pseudomonas phage pphageT12]
MSAGSGRVTRSRSPQKRHPNRRHGLAITRSKY